MSRGLLVLGERTHFRHPRPKGQIAEHPRQEVDDLSRNSFTIKKNTRMDFVLMLNYALCFMRYCTAVSSTVHNENL